MTDLASFYTIPTSATAQNSNGNAKGAAKAGGVAGIFDLLLAQLEGQISNGDENAKLLSQDKQKSAQDQAKINLMRALAGNDKVAENVEQLDEIAELDLLQEIEQTLALNQQLFDNAMRAGTGNDDLSIDKETGEIVVPDVAKSLNLLEEGHPLLSKNIKAVLDNVDLNTLNLTPEQVTLVQDIQNGLVPNEAQLEEVESILNTLLSSLVALVPPQAALQAQIQTATQAGKSNATLGAAASANGKTAPLPQPFNSAQQAEGELAFEQALKDTNGHKYAGNLKLDGDNGANGHSKNTALPQGLQGSFDILQSWPFAAAGSLYGSATYNDQTAEQLGLSLNSGQSMGQGSLSALISQAQSAAHPHPATQMVAATLTKGMKAGADTNISLRLDPPGLGRVEVSMTFGKDKTMKAVVTAEKPETYMMLQRDAQVLERALQDAGLDADSGLSFELAQDGQFFDDHNQRGGGHNQGGTGRGGYGDGEEVELIESTMTWRVDPETGHTRYNIFV